MQVIKGSGYMENMEKEEVDVIRALRGDSFEAKLDSIWKELQSHVDHVLDREMKSSAGVTNRVRISKDRPSKSFRQLWSIFEGRMGLQAAHREEAGHLPNAHDGQEGEPRGSHRHHSRYLLII